MTSEEPTRRRFFPTKVGVIVGVFVLAATTVIITSLLRGPPLDSLEAWAFPGSSLMTNIADSSVVGAMYSAPADFKKVENWYRDRLRLGNFGSPAVVITSGGVFSSARREVGLIASPVGASQITTMFSRKPEKMMVIHVSHAKGETNTMVWLILRPTHSSSNAAPAVSIVRGLTYPTSTPGSGGGAMNISVGTYAATNSFRAVQRYFAGNEPAVSGRLPVERMPDGEQSHVLSLPLTPHTRTNEATFVCIMAKALALIHVTEVTNRTQITVGAIKD